MITAEELLLLLTRDDGKPVSSSAQNAYGYAAANITDLVLAERVTLDDGKDPRVTVVDAAPVGHPVLDAALARVVEKNGKKVSSLVADGKVAAQERISRSLADAGVVDIEPKQLLGLVPERRPVRDATPERDLRERLRAVLQGTTATTREATLLAIVQGLGVAPKVFADEAGGMSKRDLTARIEQVATTDHTGEAMSEAVRRAVQAMNSAMMTAVVVPIIASGASAGS